MNCNEKSEHNSAQEHSEIPHHAKVVKALVCKVNENAAAHPPEMGYRPVNPLEQQIFNPFKDLLLNK